MGYPPIQLQQMPLAHGGIELLDPNLGGGHLLFANQQQADAVAAHAQHWAMSSGFAHPDDFYALKEEPGLGEQQPCASLVPGPSPHCIPSCSTATMTTTKRQPRKRGPSEFLEAC
jgi:hypothetical protein